MTSFLKSADIDLLLKELEYRRLRQNARALVVEPSLAEETDPDSGETFPFDFGEYQLLEPLGEGGMGRVFIAQQNGTNRRVALKMIRPDMLGELFSFQRQFSDRFLIEARVTANLRHENIVTVYEVGEVNGHHFYSMQLVEGSSLGKVIRKAPVSDWRAAIWLRSIANAVHCAHTAGILHRDIKPDNIMIDTDDRPMLMDFGLARRNNDSVDDRFTRPGTMLGTVSYMSPEQSRNSAEAMETSDVYGLGAVLYFCLTGRPPFLADNPVETLRQLRDLDPVPPRTVNPAIARDLNTICLKCLEKSPESRYSSAKEFEDDLDRFLNRRPIKAKAASPVDHALKWVGRNRALAGLLGVLAVLPFVIWGLLWLSEGQSKTRQLSELVESIENAETADMGRLLNKLKEHDREHAIGLIKETVPAALSDAQTQLNAALLYLNDPNGKHLFDQLESLKPEQVRLIRDTLQDQESATLDGLATKLEQASIGDPDFFPLACLVAGHAPDLAIWQQASPVIVNRLVFGNPAELRVWLEMLQPVKQTLNSEVERHLRSLNREESRVMATSILCEFHRDDATYLSELLSGARPRELRLIIDGLRPMDQGWDLLWNTVKQTGNTQSPTPENTVSHANASAALILLENSESAWELLEESPCRDFETELVHRLVPAGINARSLFSRIQSCQSPHALYVLLMVLGEIKVEQMNSELQGQVSRYLKSVCATHLDAGSHSAAKWVLTTWGQFELLENLCSELPNMPEPGKRNWYYTRDGQIMCCFPEGADNFFIGSPKDELFRGRDEDRKQVQLAPFAIATSETTLAQFELFKSHDLHDYTIGPTRDCPVNNVTFFEAARFCNWLSQTEGFENSQWCYEILDDGSVRPYNDFQNRQGYRLPTEAEWEFASRAESPGSRFFGQTDRWLESYAWFIRNSRSRTYPVCRLKPNHFGLFDVYGNTVEWCHKNRMDNNDRLEVLKGAAFPYGAGQLRSAQRFLAFPNASNKMYGFRVARSLSTTQN